MLTISSSRVFTSRRPLSAVKSSYTKTRSDIPERLTPIIRIMNIPLGHGKTEKSCRASVARPGISTTTPTSAAPPRR